MDKKTLNLILIAGLVYVIWKAIDTTSIDAIASFAGSSFAGGT